MKKIPFRRCPPPSSLLLTCCLLAGLHLTAQPSRNQKFAAAGFFGVTFSQIHGDAYFGYNNPGLRFGIETHYLWAPKYYLSLGIGYAQEGATPNRNEISDRGGNAASLELRTIEIPLLFNYRLGDPKARGKKHDFALLRSTTLQAGVRLTRLIGYRTVNRGYLNRILVNPPFTEGNIPFRELDIAFVGGAIFRLGLRYGLFIQHSLSLRGLYEPDDITTARNQRFEVFQLRPYGLTIGAKIVLF